MKTIDLFGLPGRGTLNTDCHRQSSLKWLPAYNLNRKMLKVCQRCLPRDQLDSGILIAVASPWPSFNAQSADCRFLVKSVFFFMTCRSLILAPLMSRLPYLSSETWAYQGIDCQILNVIFTSYQKGVFLSSCSPSKAILKVPLKKGKR